MYKCPNCGQKEKFYISGLASPWCRIDGDGAVLDYDLGDIEWDARHAMLCDECNYQSIVKDFEIEEEDDE